MTIWLLPDNIENPMLQKLGHLPFLCMLESPFKSVSSINYLFGGLLTSKKSKTLVYIWRIDSELVLGGHSVSRTNMDTTCLPMYTTDSGVMCKFILIYMFLSLQFIQNIKLNTWINNRMIEPEQLVSLMNVLLSRKFL